MVAIVIVHKAINRAISAKVPYREVSVVTEINKVKQSIEG